MGRWLSPDTDMTLKRILPNPQRWNRYAYVINNPLGRIDPDGLTDFAVFLSYAPADRGHLLAINWDRIRADAVKHGNTLTIYQGSEANSAQFQAALAKGQVTVYIGHTQLNDIPAGTPVRANAVSLSDKEVGIPPTPGQNGSGRYVPNSSGGMDAVPAEKPQPNGGTVAIFGCDSAHLSGQYSGADNFVGVDSGADRETSIPGLLSARSQFVDSSASGDSLQRAVSNANGALNQQPATDNKDKVVLNPN
jgi:hypothetical protein